MNARQKNKINTIAEELSSLSATVEETVSIYDNFRTLLAGNQPEIFEQIDIMLSGKTPLAQEEILVAVMRFTTSWLMSIHLAGPDEKKKRYLSFAKADPAILFPALAGGALLQCGDELEQSFTASLTELNRRCPLRDQENHALLTSIYRRLLGDQNATYPLLVGAPGTGKSEIARQAGKALTAAGIPTTVVFQSMTVKNGSDGNQVEMNLLGTDSHYANAEMGKIYKECSRKDVALCLVVLDEADKHSNCYELLISLLDPKQPLQDHFIQSVCESMNMRCKTIFILSANDQQPLNNGPSDPLWSRLRPIFFKPYTAEQIVQLLSILAMREYHSVYPLTEKNYRQIAEQLVTKHGTSCPFRSYFNLIGEYAINQQLPTGNYGGCSTPQVKRVGFALS